MLARGGIALHMTEDGIIERLGSREVRQAVERLPVSGTRRVSSFATLSQG
jgi:hypothetical protein